MRSLILATTLLAAGTVGSYAADAPMMMIEPPEAPAYSDPGIYVQLLGGAALGLDSTFWSPAPTGVDYPMDTGYALAGTIGVVVMDGLSIEADVFHTSRAFAEVDDWSLATTSLMGNLKYTVAVSDTFSIYAAAGLGYVWLNYNEDGDEFNYANYGYQLIAGASMDVADNVAIVGELRYQNTFEEAPWDEDGDYLVQAPTVGVMAGIKVGF